MLLLAHLRVLAGIVAQWRGHPIFKRFPCAIGALALPSGMPEIEPNSQDNQATPVRAIRKAYAKSDASAFSASARLRLFGTLRPAIDATLIP